MHMESRPPAHLLPSRWPQVMTGRRGRRLLLRLVVVVAVLAGLGWAAVSTFRALPSPVRARVARQILAPIAEWRHGEPASVALGPVFPEGNRPGTDAAALQAAAAPLARGRAVTVRRLKNPPLVRTRYDFAWQDPADPALDGLVERLGLGPFKDFPGDELGMVRALVSHVRSRAPHLDWVDGGSTLVGVEPGAHHILDRVDAGGTLTCYYYSLLLVQGLAALGRPARVLASGVDLRNWHAVAEVWNHEHRKWMVADPDFDLVYVRGEEPLNAWELHDAFMAGYTQYRRALYRMNAEDSHPRRAEWFAEHPQSYAGIEILRGTVDAPRIPEHLARTEGGILLGAYWTFSVALRNDYLSVDYPTGHPRATRELALGDLGAGWLRAYDGEFTNRPGDLYFDVDTVQLGFEAAPDEAGGAIRVLFDTYTPGFAGFRVQVDDQAPFETGEPTLLWKLGPDGGRLRVWPVNTRGVVGTLTEAEVSFIGP